MNPIVIVTMILFPTALFGQIETLKNGKNWKLYNVADENAFEYRRDTLKNFSSIPLSTDSMRLYLDGLTEMPAGGPHIWMGAYIATYELNGEQHKVEISYFGGVIYDESTRKHYEIRSNKSKDWLSYIRNSYLQFEKM